MDPSRTSSPRQLWFIGEDWEHVIGSRESFVGMISAITDIPKDYILEFKGSTVSHGPHYPGLPSIAEIMSWASRRVTTRIEDIAYSLMGIFGVQMPLLYGEGRNAFQNDSVGSASLFQDAYPDTLGLFSRHSHKAIPNDIHVSLTYSIMKLKFETSKHSCNCKVDLRVGKIDAET